jgi:hypothetical protein
VHKFVLLGAACVVLLAGQGVAQATPATQQFLPTGDEQSFVVPDGVTNIHVVAIGGKGGKGNNATALGGFGSVVSADFAVTPGQTVTAVVGGNGGDAVGAVGGAGGTAVPSGIGAGGDGGGSKPGIEKAGGGGGAASYVYIGDQGILPGLIVVAAGGGGSGGTSGGGAGGIGSFDDGTNGQNGSPGAAAQFNGGVGGAGGTQSPPSGSGSGVGKFLRGGTGVFGFADNSGGGGGGGAGVWGGNGGGEGDINGAGGGGGAGSSAGSSNATNVSYARDKTGAPSITFTYDVPSSPGGGNPGGADPGGGNSPLLVPALSAFKGSPKTFAAASHGGSTGGTVGMTITYTAATAGTTKFTVLAPRRGVTAAKCVKPKRGRHGKSCTRYVSLGSFTHKDAAGFNTFVFTGRVRRHNLPRGSYRLQAVSSANGKKSKAVTLSFRIVR